MSWWRARGRPRPPRPRRRSTVSAKVHVAEGGVLDHDLAEPLAALLVRLAQHHKTILAPATASTKNVMPRVAALLDVMQVSEIIKVVAPDTFERPIYAGNAIQTVRTADPVKVITVRTAAFAATPAGSSVAPIETLESAVAAMPPSIRPCRTSAARNWPGPTGRS